MTVDLDALARVNEGATAMGDFGLTRAQVRALIAELHTSREQINALEAEVERLRKLPPHHGPEPQESRTW